MPKNTEYISVSELSESVQKSKQWIYKLIKTDADFRKYVKTIGGKQMVHTSAISEFFKVPAEEIKPDEQFVAVLQEQLSIANKRIDELMEALKNEQLLHGQTAARLQQATLLIEELQKQPEDPEQTDRTEQPEDPEPEHQEPESQGARSDDVVVDPVSESAATEPQTVQGSTDQSQESAPETGHKLSFLERIRILFSGEV